MRQLFESSVDPKGPGGVQLHLKTYPLQRSFSGDNYPVTPRRMDEIHLHQIQEKTVIGSYSNGLIPIRSASFSSSEPYKKRKSWAEKNEAKPLRTIVSPQETDKAVIEEDKSAIISEELETETTTESDHGSRRTSINVKVTSEMNEDQNEPGASDVVIEAKSKSREKMLEHFKANATPLSRSSSWKSPPLNFRATRRDSSKVKDCKLPASLQHLQLEASNCPSSMKVRPKTCLVRSRGNRYVTPLKWPEMCQGLHSTEL